MRVEDNVEEKGIDKDTKEWRRFPQALATEISCLYV
jgi:hypothetical protein